MTADAPILERSAGDVAVAAEYSLCRAARDGNRTMARSVSGKPAGGTGTKPRARNAAAHKSNGRAFAAKVTRRLKADYSDAECALEHQSAFQLLVSTILSAQCTDERVNIVTKDLFRRWPTAAHLARLPLGQLEQAIKSTGFFRNKAKNIKACSQALVDKYDGEVPRDLDQLVELPGVGRKTANVVLGTAYGLATGVVVDTHVTRLSQRLGLTKQTDAVKIEQDLISLLPKSEWINFSHRMIHHGRRICTARKPKCDRCSMEKFCPKIDVN
jgi:endonuclease-3